MIGYRGGAFSNLLFNLAAPNRPTNGDPAGEGYFSVGFRVVNVPEPGSLILLLCGAIGLLAWAWKRRQV